GRHGTCRHVLHTVDGAIVEVALNDGGDLVEVARPERLQIKRARRADGTFRFSVGVRIGCPHGDLTTWLSPHPADDRDAGRPENVRLIPPGDADFDRLYGPLRADAESVNSH